MDSVSALAENGKAIESNIIGHDETNQVQERPGDNHNNGLANEIGDVENQSHEHGRDYDCDNCQDLEFDVTSPSAKKGTQGLNHVLNGLSVPPYWEYVHEVRYRLKEWDDYTFRFAPNITNLKGIILDHRQTVVTGMVKRAHYFPIAT
eukprot:Awhi_evm1s4987